MPFVFCRKVVVCFLSVCPLTLSFSADREPPSYCEFLTMPFLPKTTLLSSIPTVNMTCAVVMLFLAGHGTLLQILVQQK
jgi:hypothetical protein